MPVLADSYMGVFMPPDIAQRIARFIAGKLDFPFLQKNEVMANSAFRPRRVTAAADRTRAIRKESNAS